MARTLDEIESTFGITLPGRHRAALADPHDPLLVEGILLTPEGNEVQSIFTTNKDLRATNFKEWPDWLVAFATEGCGDYYAYDTRHYPYPIYHIDPMATAAESIQSNKAEGSVFKDFDAWYDAEVRDLG